MAIEQLFNNGKQTVRYFQHAEYEVIALVPGPAGGEPLRARILRHADGRVEVTGAPDDFSAVLQDLADYLWPDPVENIQSGADYGTAKKHMKP
jgi:hypothetical protein